MPRRRIVTSRGFRRLNRETQWLTIPPVRGTMTSPSEAQLSHVLTTAEKALRPFTIVRTRILFHANSDATVVEFWHAVLGCAVVSDQAVAIGITAIPTPDTDRVSDLWFVFDEIAGISDGSGGTDAAGPLGRLRYVDSKAMRKVEEGEDVVIVQELSAASLGATVMVSGRLLIKLH